MKLKQGITLAVTTVVVTILAILTTAVVKTVHSNLTNVNFTIWVQEMTTIQDMIQANKQNAEEYLLESLVFNV